MRDFEIRYVNEFSFVTEWLDDSQEGFDLLRKKTKEISENYFKFLSVIADIKGIQIEYYDLDSDDFGSDKSCDDVIKWLVKLQGSDIEGVTEKLCNEESFVKIKYRVVDTITKEILLEDDFDKCVELIENKLPQYDITTDEGAEEIVKYMYIEEYQEKYLALN